MVKVCILDSCEFCDKEAYFFDYQDVDSLGETYDRYQPCSIGHGSFNQAKWVGLRELADLLGSAIDVEPDIIHTLLKDQIPCDH